MLAPTPTLERDRELLAALKRDFVRIDHHSGLAWRVRGHGGKAIAFERGWTGNIHKRRYWRVEWRGQRWLAHRLCFLWDRGYLPAEVDHKDTNGLNNMPDNLREADDTTNTWNTKGHRDSTCPIKGIWKEPGRWRAEVMVHGRKFRKSVVSDVSQPPYELIAWLESMRMKWHGEFARHA